MHQRRADIVDALAPTQGMSSAPSDLWAQSRSQFTFSGVEISTSSRQVITVLQEIEDAASIETATQATADADAAVGVRVDALAPTPGMQDDKTSPPV